MSTLESFRLVGKVAVVTGGARDLGYDMADALAEAGAHLVITSRELDHAAKAAEKLHAAHGVEALPLALDQCDHAQIALFARKARDWKGRVDVLVNNAGGGKSKGPTNFFDRQPEDVIALIHLNLIGVLFCCQEFGRIMAAQGSGKIINIGSIAGMVGRDRRMYDQTGLAQQAVDYAAAKGGVIAMTRDIAAVLAPKGVCVNTISPGGFTSPRRNHPEAFVKAYSEHTALGRMGRDGVDLKGAVLFLASSASDYVTGQNLVVDGGFCMWK